jgi:hypothetical protein
MFAFCLGPASAQLRPLEPFLWDAFFDTPVHVTARAAWLDEQRASLAGTVGRLIELGEVRALVRTGAVVLEFAGTPQRLFADERVFAPPAGGATSPGVDGERHDAGDYRVGTAVRLTRASERGLAALRFGARLPTTDNRVGLDRDQTDFFALLGGQYRRSGLRVSAEFGVGINGTRSESFEQSDVLLYAATFEYAGNLLSPRLTVVGQDDLSTRMLRGNEDLAELRAGVRAGRKRWLETGLVYGLRTFSPEIGVWLGGGAALDWR